ncbi:hypothetical protein BG004_003820, partial [Podila humilis]
SSKGIEEPDTHLAEPAAPAESYFESDTVGADDGNKVEQASTPAAHKRHREDNIEDEEESRYNVTKKRDNAPTSSSSSSLQLSPSKGDVVATSEQDESDLESDEEFIEDETSDEDQESTTPQRVIDLDSLMNGAALAGEEALVTDLSHLDDEKFKGRNRYYMGKDAGRADKCFQCGQSGHQARNCSADCTQRRPAYAQRTSSAFSSLNVQNAESLSRRQDYSSRSNDTSNSRDYSSHHDRDYRDWERDRDRDRDKERRDRDRDSQRYRDKDYDRDYDKSYDRDYDRRDRDRDRDRDYDRDYDRDRDSGRSNGSSNSSSRHRASKRERDPYYKSAIRKHNDRDRDPDLDTTDSYDLQKSRSGNRNSNSNSNSRSSSSRNDSRAEALTPTMATETRFHPLPARPQARISPPKGNKNVGDTISASASSSPSSSSAAAAGRISFAEQNAFPRDASYGSGSSGDAALIGAGRSHGQLAGVMTPTPGPMYTGGYSRPPPVEPRSQR